MIRIEPKQTLHVHFACAARAAPGLLSQGNTIGASTHHMHKHMLHKHIPINRHRMSQMCNMMLLTCCSDADLRMLLLPVWTS